MERLGWSGEQKDWTDKLNNGKDVAIDPLFFTQPRQWIFKDSEESDIYNFSYQQEWKESFGERQQDSGIEVITGKREIKSIFAPAPIAPIGNADKFLIPHFAKDTEGERQPIQVKPRLMFYNGKQAAPYTWYLEDDFATAQGQSEYPVFSQFDRYPFDETALDLNWQNVVQFWELDDVGTSVGDGRTPKDIYKEYWERWFNDTFSATSRIFEGTFILDYDDVTRLKFNDLIYIKDAWYMPIEVSDYVLGTTSEVKVKLVKLGTVGININIEGPGAGVKSYNILGLCSGQTLCDAYCCTNFTQYSLWSANETLITSSELYLDAQLTIPAYSGYYSDGTNAVYVGRNGQIQFFADPSSCNCNPLTVFSSACKSADFCASCCCTTYAEPIYYDGVSLDSSTRAYSSNLYAPLDAGYWYRESGGSPVFIGRDGITIVQTGFCGNCNCNPLEEDIIVGQGSTIPGSCCGQGATGSGGITTVYSDTDYVYTGSTFYYDPNELYPVGATGTAYLSDGYVYAEVLGGTAGASGSCPSNATMWTECPDRTIQLRSQLVNNEGVSTELLINYEISFDGVNWLSNGRSTSTGTLFSDLYYPKFAAGTYVRFQVIVPPIYGGTVEYEIIKNGETVLGPTTDTPTFYTLGSGPISEGDLWEANFVWAAP